MKKVEKVYNVVILILLVIAISLCITPYSFNKYYNLQLGPGGYSKTDIHNINTNIMNSSKLGLLFFICMCLLFIWMIIRIILKTLHKSNFITNTAAFNFVCVCGSFFGILSSVLGFLQVSNKEYVKHFDKSFNHCKYHLIDYSTCGKFVLIGLITVCIIMIVYSFIILLRSSTSE